MTVCNAWPPNPGTPFGPRIPSLSAAGGVAGRAAATAARIAVSCAAVIVPFVTSPSRTVLIPFDGLPSATALPKETFLADVLASATPYVPADRATTSAPATILLVFIKPLFQSS